MFTVLASWGALSVVVSLGVGAVLARNGRPATVDAGADGGKSGRRLVAGNRPG